MAVRSLAARDFCHQISIALLFTLLLTSRLAQADSEAPPPAFTLKQTPAGTFLRLGNQIHLFKDVSPSDVYSKLLKLPVGPVLVTLTNHAPHILTVCF